MRSVWPIFFENLENWKKTENLETKNRSALVNDAPEAPGKPAERGKRGSGVQCQAGRPRQKQISNLRAGRAGRVWPDFLYEKMEKRWVVGWKNLENLGTKNDCQ